MVDLAKLRELQTLSEQLAQPAVQRQQHIQQATAHGQAFLDRLPELPVYGSAPPKKDSLAAMQLTPQGRPLADALGVLSGHVDGIGHNLGSARFFAYIPSGALHEAAVADYLAALSNRYSGVGNAAPGATRMDEVLLRWMGDFVGYPTSMEGDFTSGGSIAALSAIVTARESRRIRSRDVERCVVYLSAQTHHTFAKALRIAGMGDCVTRIIQLDHQHRMIAQQLDEQVTHDKKQGLAPWFVCASAGTTDTGAIDPLEDIAHIATRHQLWCHVDGAYGGSFAQCEEGKRRLTGLGASDSLLLDPHKGMFLPCGTGVLLVRDGNQLRDAYRERGVYMQDVENDPERSPCDLSPELTRPFRALRLWLPLRIHGTRAFAAALEEKLLLAHYFYEQIQTLERSEGVKRVEVGSPPDLSIVPFRITPTHGDAEAFNKALLDRIVEDGRVFMASTRINGVYTLRMAILNYQSHKEDVDVALDVIRTQISLLQST